MPPIARSNARVLILGSLPGDASLAAKQYYAHPRNCFWRLVGGAIGIELVGMDYVERIMALQTNGIALWDVIGEAERPGSLDKKIRNAQANDLRAFVDKLQDLRAIAFNGKTAAALALRIFDTPSFDMLHLPSSSPAHAISLTTKHKAWAILADYIKPMEHRASMLI